MKKFLLAAAAVLPFAFAPQALAQQNHSGFALSAGADQISGDVSYSGGKPDESLSGSMGVWRVSFDHQFGQDGGLVLGASYADSFGSLNADTQRDGNYLVQGATLSGLSSWEVRAGWAFGRFMPYAAYGKLSRDMSVWQSCPDDHNAAPFGFCSGGGNAALGDAREGRRTADAGQEADMWRIGVEVMLGQHGFVDLSYAEADFGTQVVNLDADPAIVPPTDPTQDVRTIGLKTGWRF